MKLSQFGPEVASR